MNRPDVYQVLQGARGKCFSAEEAERKAIVDLVKASAAFMTDSSKVEHLLAAACAYAAARGETATAEGEFRTAVREVADAEATTQD